MLSAAAPEVAPALPSSIADLIAKAKARQAELATTEREIKEAEQDVAQEATLREARHKKHLMAQVAEKRLGGARPSPIQAQAFAALRAAEILSDEDIAGFQAIDAQLGTQQGTQDAELQKLNRELIRTRHELQAAVVSRAQEQARAARVSYDEFFKPFKPVSKGAGGGEFTIEKPRLFARIMQEALGINQAMDAARRKEDEKMRGEAMRVLTNLEDRQKEALRIIDSEIMQTKPGKPGLLDQLIATIQDRSLTNDQAKEVINKLRDEFIVKSLARMLDREPKKVSVLEAVYPRMRDPHARDSRGRTRYEALVGNLNAPHVANPLQADPKAMERLQTALMRNRAFDVLFAPEMMKRVFARPGDIREERHQAKEQAKEAERKAHIETERREHTAAVERKKAEAERVAREAAEAVREEALRAARE